ncbi:MAG: hypothetical protein N2663_07985 [Chlorobi bacterium]|nr:hypothetical protein [Chlorobiota bacterium]
MNLLRQKEKSNSPAGEGYCCVACSCEKVEISENGSAMSRVFTHYIIGYIGSSSVKLFGGVVNFVNDDDRGKRSCKIERAGGVDDHNNPDQPSNQLSKKRNEHLDCGHAAKTQAENE